MEAKARETSEMIAVLSKRLDVLEEEMAQMKMKRKTKKNGDIDGRTKEGRELLLKRLIEDDAEVNPGRSTKKTCRDGKPDMRTIEGRSLWAAMERTVS